MEPVHLTTTVSAVIPAYNSAAFIAKAIESALAQTYPLAEIIVVDDGSSDETAEIAKSYAGVRVIKQPNRGVGAARNAGIWATTSDWVAFLDSDDAWSPEKTEIQVACITDEVGVVHNNRFDSIHFGSLWHRQAYLTPSGTMVRRQSLLDVGGFEESREIMSTEDLNLWLKIALTKWQFVRSEGVLFSYQPAAQSLSANDLKMARAELAGITLIADHVKCQQKEVGRIRRASRLEYARNLIAHRRWKDALCLLQELRPGRATLWLSAARFFKANRLARVDFVRWLLCTSEKYESHCCSGECNLPNSIKTKCMKSCHSPYFVQIATGCKSSTSFTDYAGQNNATVVRT